MKPRRSGRDYGDSQWHDKEVPVHIRHLRPPSTLRTTRSSMTIMANEAQKVGPALPGARDCRSLAAKLRSQESGSGAGRSGELVARPLAVLQIEKLRTGKSPVGPSQAVRRPRLRPRLTRGLHRRAPRISLVWCRSRSASWGRRKVLTVLAGDLHVVVGSGRDFPTWFKDQVQRSRLRADVDYCKWVFPGIGENTGLGRPRRELVLALDSAKEIGIMAAGDYGKRLRRYFLDCEFRLPARLLIKDAMVRRAGGAASGGPADRET